MQGYAWAEDKEHCEEYGRMLQADPSKVSERAKKRGLPQVAPASAATPFLEAHTVMITSLGSGPVLPVLPGVVTQCLVGSISYLSCILHGGCVRAAA